MQRALLSIEAALLILLFALIALSAAVPRAAHAADLPDGVAYCGTVNGVWTCYGVDNTTCSDVDGVYTCNAKPGTGGGASGSPGSGMGKVVDRVKSTGTGWLSKLTNWCSDMVRSLVDALLNILKDFATFVLRAVMDLAVAAISAIGVPNFLQNYSLGNTLGQAGPVAGFFLTQLKIPQGLAMIGAGYVFRLARKFLTLFQW